MTIIYIMLSMMYLCVYNVCILQEGTHYNYMGLMSSQISLMNYIRSCDQFGIPYTPTINRDEVKYKSFFGGLVSIILYSLSLAYFIYKVYLWQTNQILPKSSQQQATVNYLDVTFNQYDPINIFMKSLGGDQNINPFKEQGNIITVYQQYINGLNFEKKVKIFSEDQGIITPKQLNLVLSDRYEVGDKQQRQLMLLFEICNPQTLNDNQTCASQEAINEYLKQPLNTLFITVKLKQFNPKKQGFETFTKQIYLLFDSTSTAYGSTIFQTTTSKTVQGLIFDSSEEFQYVNNFDFSTQQISQTFFKNSLSMDLVAVLLFRIDSLSETQVVQYPKLGEILADVGSIMQTLLTLKIIAVIINQKLQEEQALLTIITYFYPEFKEIQFIKNWFGQVKSFVYRDCEVKDSKEFQKFYEKLKDRAAEKLTVTNQIYEISRLQFGLQQLQDRSKLQSLHSLGIHIDPKYICINEKKLISSEQKILVPQELIIKQKKSQELREKNEHQLILQDEDFMLLSLQGATDHKLKSELDNLENEVI